MSISLLVILVILLAVIVYMVFGLATNSVDDFFKKIWLKTLWLWLPIHAFGRLSRELREKRLKK